MRSKIADSLPKISWGFFFATLIFIPFRFKLFQIERPVGIIWEDYTDLIFYLTDLTVLLTLATWFVTLIISRKKVKKGPAFLTLPLVGLTLVAFLTSFTSIDPMLSIYHSIRLAILLGFYLYVINHVSSLGQIIPALVFMTVVQSLVAVTQVLTQHSLGLKFLGEFDLDPAWRGVSVVWSDTIRSLRAYGLSDHPNILGGCLVFALTFLTFWHLDKKPVSSGLSIVIGLGLLALFFTFSRSAWLGLLVGAIFIAYHRYIKQKRFPRTEAIFLASLVLLLVPFLWANRELLGIRLGEQISIQQIQPELGSMGERRVLTSAANTVFAEHAIFGIGLGGSPQAFFREFPVFPIDYAPPHNVLISAALETGLIGALFYLLLLISPWLAAYTFRKRKVSNEFIATSAVLLAFTVIGFFDVYPWLVQAGRLLQYLTWGLWAHFFEVNTFKS
jgi:O-antigen ligase